MTLSSRSQNVESRQWVVKQEKRHQVLKLTTEDTGGRLGTWVSKCKFCISPRNREQRYPRTDHGHQEQGHGLKPYRTQITKLVFLK